MNRKKTRREFLRVPPVPLARAYVQSEAASGGIGDDLRPERGMLSIRLSRRAMATQFEIRFPGDVSGPAGGRERDVQLALETLESLDGLEEQMSLFRPASEINRINLLAAEMPVEVEPGLFRLLSLAKDIWRKTEGAMDITVTPLWRAWGFDARAGTVPKEEQIAEAMSRTGFQFVDLDDQRNTVRFTRPGIQLNLGGIGKGYALDQCAAKLIGGGMKHFLLHAGQSSVLAHGLEVDQAVECRKKNRNCHHLRAGGQTFLSAGPGPFGQDAKPRETADDKKQPREEPAQVFSDFWTIGIPHPWKTRRRVAEITLRDRAAGTSGSRFQSFRHKGKLYGHILDPRTGRPAEGMFSATVLAPSAALADALSTAFYVLGVEKSLAYTQANPEIGAVLLTHCGRGGDVEIHCCGLDDGDFRVQ